MDFKDFLIYLSIAVLAVFALSIVASLGVALIGGAWHKATKHCDTCSSQDVTHALTEARIKDGARTIGEIYPNVDASDSIYRSR